MAIATQTVPASASRFARRSIASLSWSRQRMRWYGVGAIRSAEPSAVNVSATR